MIQSQSGNLSECQYSRAMKFPFALLPAPLLSNISHCHRWFREIPQKTSDKSQPLCLLRALRTGSSFAFAMALNLLSR